MCYLTHSRENKGVHTFPKGICPKVNVIARLEFELAYYDSTTHPFNYYTTMSPQECVESYIYFVPVCYSHVVVLAVVVVSKK